MTVLTVWPTPIGDNYEPRGGFKVTFYMPEIFQGHWFASTDEVKSGMMVENRTGARPK